MGQAVDRDMDEEFRQGTIDNSYIQIAPNRGGMVEMADPIDRALNWAPYQYLNVEVHGLDPWAVARQHRAARPVEPLSRYVPRRDRVGRPL